MNFFHVPSFEDHHTMKIWLKNWNLPVNKTLFKIIHRVNNLFNSLIDVEHLKSMIDNEVLQTMFPHKKWTDERIKFQIYIKDDFNSKEEIASHFYRKMHFLFYIVEVNTEEEREVTDLVNSLKKFAFLRNLTSLMTIAVCKTDVAEEAMRSLDHVIIVKDHNAIDESVFKSRILPIFMKGLKEKLIDIPKVDKKIILCSPEEFAVSLRKKASTFTEGKILKLRGDVSLILGSINDSLNYYGKALEVFNNERKSPGSSRTFSAIKLWIGSVYESISACYYMKMKEKLSDLKTDSVSKDLISQLSNYSSKAMDVYKAEKLHNIIYELTIKLLGFYSFLKDKKNFISCFNSLRDYTPLISFDPRIYLYIGDLAYNTGLKRIAICALFECSWNVKKHKEYESIKNECLQLCAKIMKLDVENYKNNFGMLEVLPKQITYIILFHLLDINLTNKNNEQALHYHLLLMRKFEIERTYKKITELILWEYPFYNYEYDVLPFIQRIVPKSRTKEFREINKSKTENKGKLSESVFIYDPRNRSKFIDLNWVAQQEAEVSLFLTNPLHLEVRIDSISLETDGVAVSNYSKEVILHPFQRNYNYRFKIRPVQTGVMAIKGVKIRIGNLIYINTVDSRGVGNIYKYVKKENPYIFEQYYLNNDINLDKIPVAESIPVIDMQSRNYCPETIFYNENVSLLYRITNFSKITAKDILLKVRIDYENAHTVNLEHELNRFELQHNKFIDLTLDLKQGERIEEKDKKENFEIKGNDKIYLVYENRNLIERVYKITTTIESRFEDNKNYVSCKETVKIFKVG